MSRKHGETEDTHDVEVAILPRETWEFVKGLLEVFEEVLQEASSLSSRSKATGDDADRLAALKSLEAVMDLVDALVPDNRKNLIGPIFQTYEALLGVYKGAAPHPLLIAKPTGGRPTAKPEIERFQGEAAAAMQLLMVAGDLADEAASKVARQVQRFDLESLGYTPKVHKGITANTIKGWRNKFTGHTGRSLGAMRFKTVLGLEYVKKKKPKSAASWVLKSLLGSSIPPEYRKIPPS